jgi:hypothetical protein
MSNHRQGPRLGRRVGGSGGRVDRKTLEELREFWDKFFTSEEYRENLKQRILDGQAQNVEILFHHLCYGRPRETLDVHHQGDGQFTLIICGKVVRQQAIEGGKVIDLKGDGLEVLTGDDSAEAGGIRRCATPSTSERDE